MKRFLFLMVALLTLSFTSCKKDSVTNTNETASMMSREQGYKKGLEHAYAYAMSKKQYEMANIIANLRNRPYDEKAINEDIYNQYNK